jgi:hypothetical protein
VYVGFLAPSARQVALRDLVDRGAPSYAEAPHACGLLADLAVSAPSGRCASARRSEGVRVRQRLRVPLRPAAGEDPRGSSARRCAPHGVEARRDDEIDERMVRTSPKVTAGTVAHALARCPA